ncbi:energy transducer TonB [Lewinella cohaerens]|uniref:energy transducer TonB n=1 Tax=Lewinella cohaerens TaxID=70995 RepID=UPI00036163DF|nr:energy transducer TonB [Lewinella cohaerens]
MFTNFSFTGSEVFLGLGLLAALVIGIIIAGRYRLSNLAQTNLKSQHANDPVGAEIKARNKYPEVDVLHNTGIFWKLGLVVVLALTVMAFNWTQFENKVDIPEGAMDMDFDIEMEAPPQTTTPPPPPPPPPPVIEEVPSDAVLLDEQETFSDQSASANLAVSNAPVAKVDEGPAPPPPPPPPPPALEVKEIFKIVEDMPRFPGCEDVGTKEEKMACSQQKLLEFIYDNIKYPAIARDNNVSGTVVVRFVVQDDGSIENAEILRDIGADCGAEALRVVKLMRNLPEKWTPGKQRGRNVPVYFNLPIKFVLQVDH